MRWACAKQSSDKSLAKITVKEENFNFRLYAFVPIEIHRVQKFEEVSLEATLVHCLSVPMSAKFFFGVVAPTILPFKLEFEEGAIMYNPQWLVRQFGYH